MQSEPQERRTMRRFDMRLPAIVHLEGSDEVHTETQNVSARGVFLYLDRAVSAGTKLEVTLTFPPHITLTDALRVRFTARVIRVENPLPSARIGTAAIIEDYQFLRSVSRLGVCRGSRLIAPSSSERALTYSSDCHDGRIWQSGAAKARRGERMQR